MKIVLHVTVTLKEGLGCPRQPRHLGSRATSNEAEWKMLHQCGPLRLMKYEQHWLREREIPDTHPAWIGVRSVDCGSGGIGYSNSFRTVPYRTVPYRTVPYRTVPYRTKNKKLNFIAILPTSFFTNVYSTMPFYCLLPLGTYS